MLIYLILLLFLTDVALSTYNEATSREYWSYNTVAYCKPEKILGWEVGKAVSFYPQMTEIRVYENKGTDNLGFLAYNPETQTIVLSFRGSNRNSFQNWVLQNINMFRTSYLNPQCAGCFVHRGFYQAYNNLPVSDMMFDIKALKSKYPNAKVVITGHSLGAAMANFAYLDACDTISQVDLIITYGAPRVGNAEFATYAGNKKCGGEKIRVVNYREMVQATFIAKELRMTIARII